MLDNSHCCKFMFYMKKKTTAKDLQPHIDNIMVHDLMIYLIHLIHLLYHSNVCFNVFSFNSHSIQIFVVFPIWSFLLVFGALAFR